MTWEKEKPKGLVRDSVHQIWRVARPEEKIRQALVDHMVRELGFPPSLISVEMSINAFVHVQERVSSAPNRRVDIVCFAQGIHPQYDLYPLLLVECKAVKITNRVKRQLTGYNDFVQAYFVAVANEEEVQTGWYDSEKERYEFVSSLPTYRQLLEVLGIQS